MSLNNISEKLKIKKTTVEHWFRNDKSFSIPDSNIWMQLKNLLNIKTSIFDASIMEFIEKNGEFEQGNRVYDVNGLAPTITNTSSDERIIDTNIRRLTPRECFRLQDFPDTFKMPCSDSQMYKQAGNSITVGVLYNILKNLL